MITAAYVALQIRSYIGVLRRAPVIYPDSITYETLSHYSVTSHHFWHDAAWGLPLFYKLLPGTTAHVAPMAQWLLSMGSWLVLATVVANCMRNAIVSAVSYAVVLAFSLAPLVSQWNGALLTESLSISLCVLAIAALLSVVRQPTWRRAVLVIVATFFACATRDTNIFFLGVLVVAAAVVLTRRRLGIALVLVASVVVILGNGFVIGNREQGSVANNLAMRIFPSPTATAYFVNRGLPYTPQLPGIIIDDRYPPGTWLHDPRLADFRTWLDARGNHAYVTYLLTHPDYSLGDAMRNLPMMISPSRALPIGLDFFRQPGFKDGLPGVSDVLYPSGGWLVIGWVLIASVVALIAAFAGMASAVWIVPAAMIVSVIPHAIVVWDADPFAIDRHSLLIGVSARLALWLVLLFAVEGYVGRRHFWTASA